MKKIDYIYKNFDVIAFSKNLKKIKKSECSELSDFLTSIVLESTRDISQIRKEINYHQFTKSKPEWNNWTLCEILKKFGNNYSEKDIVKYFIKIYLIWIFQMIAKSGKSIWYSRKYRRVLENSKTLWNNLLRATKLYVWK